MFPLPFQLTAYEQILLAAQIPLKLLVFAHVPTAILAVTLGVFLYKKTKKLSAFYLMLLCLNFALWLYCDLLSWTSGSWSVMFAWSVLDVVNVASYITAYWFLYSFVRGYDIPLWQKVATACALVPTIVITVLSRNMDSFFTPTMIAVENDAVVSYNLYVRVFFLVLILGFTAYEYFKAADATNKKKIVLAGVGTAIFIFFLQLAELLTAYVLATNLWGWGENSYAYNFSVYGLFGIPLFLGLLGYLVVKYQAFDLKILKTVWLIIVLQLLLFITIFI